MTNEQLCYSADDGNIRDRNELWEKTGRLFKFIAHKLYVRYRDIAAAHGVELDDCLSVCWFAFLAAVRDYAKKPDRDVEFTAFANLHVKREVYKLLGLRSSAKDSLDYAASLDEPMPADDGEVTLGDTIQDPTAEAPFEEIERSDIAEYVLQRVSLLPGRQCDIIRRRYWDDAPFTAIAAELGLTPKQTRNIYGKALRKLRRDEKIQEIYRNYYADANFFKCTGLTAFRESGVSSVEWHVLKMEELIARAKGGDGYGAGKG
jgi:RNA polymerase sigma factor (sigma-70 family)